MYELYYGLNERPFDLSPNARFLFLSRKHREALTHLEYALRGRPGLTVLVGEAGTGKTTLIRATLQSHPSVSRTLVHVPNPTLTRAEFYEHLADGFGFSSNAAASKTRFLRELEEALATRPVNGVGFAILVDEAQSMPHELLEEIRLLSNIESPSGRSLGVVLVGQPELAARLNDPALRQLKQRVALRCELGQLDLPETASYISVRVKVAGGQPEQLFSRDAVVAIHQYSEGIPRTISVICDNALINGFATGAMPIGPDIVLEVCRDFEIAPAGMASTAPAAPPTAAAVGPQAARTTETATPHSVSTVPVQPPAADAAASPSLDVPAREVPAREATPLFSGFTKTRRFFQFSR
jgi:general secretion pathway protein A